MKGYIYLDFFVFVVFVLHVGLVYYYSFSFLKFLISVEMSLMIVYVCMKLMVSKYEVTFLLLFLSIIACGAAVGLALLVSWVRFEDKKNVKSNVFGGF